MSEMIERDFWLEALREAGGASWQIRDVEGVVLEAHSLDGLRVVRVTLWPPTSAVVVEQAVAWGVTAAPSGEDGPRTLDLAYWQSPEGRQYLRGILANWVSGGSTAG